jgi:hypothetical protein
MVLRGASAEVTFSHYATCGSSVGPLAGVIGLRAGCGSIRQRRRESVPSVTVGYGHGYCSPFMNRAFAVMTCIPQLRPEGKVICILCSSALHRHPFAMVNIMRNGLAFPGVRSDSCVDRATRGTKDHHDDDFYD